MRIKLLLYALLLPIIYTFGQNATTCTDCPAFDPHGKIEVKGIKESIIGNPSDPIEIRVKQLISQMTIDEKISQLVNESDSIPRLGLPAYDYWSECLHGVARAGTTTVFPQAINLASTWDPALVQQVASAISTEARIKNLEIGKGLVYWSPTINMARDPRWGRNEETYGEDPFLTSRIGVSFVKGLQGDHPKYLKTVATIKHFVANNQENDRFNSSSEIPIKQLYEYYFPAYEACIREAKVESVMTAYNAINGVPPSGSRWLLDEVLRKEWQFDGFVVSDCGAIGVMNWQHRSVNSLEEAAALGLNRGCDLECGTSYKEKMKEALEQKLVTEEVIDRALTRILIARFKLGEFDPLHENPYNHYDKSLVAGETHTKLAYESAVNSIVLLKNESFLPLDKKKIKSIAIIGPFADHNYLGGYSGEPPHNISLFEGIKQSVGKEIKVSYLMGTEVIDETDTVKVIPPLDIKAIEAFVEGKDIVIITVGADEKMARENYDMPSIYLPENQEELLKVAYRKNKNVLLVFHTGNPITSEWADSNIPAILQGWYPGQEGGRAFADIIWGDKNPSAKLPMTIYKSEEQLHHTLDYDITKGRSYRYLKSEPLYGFGHGLSYSIFDFSDIKCDAVFDGHSLECSISIANMSDIVGSEVVQVYISRENTPVYTFPLKKLVGFEKVNLMAKEKKQINFSIPVRELSIWEEGVWEVLPGKYTLFIGGGQPEKAEGKSITFEVKRKTLLSLEK